MSDGVVGQDAGSVPLQPTRVAQNTSWNIADLVVSLVVGTIASIIVARGLGPTVLGKYQFVVWMASIVSTLTRFGVPSAASRNIGQYLAANQVGLAGAVLRKTFVLQGAIAAIALALGAVLVMTVLPAHDRVFGFIAFVAVIPALFMAIPTGLNELDDRFNRNVIPSIIAVVLDLGGAIAVVAFDLGLVGLAVSSLVARTADCLIRTTWAMPRIRMLLAAATTLPPDVERAFLRLAKEAAAIQLLAFAVWNRSEIVFLGWLSTSEQIAFFSLAYGLSTRLGMLPIASARTYVPAILRSHGVDPQASVDTTARSVRVQALLGYPMFAALAVSASPIIHVLYGAQYLPAIPAVIILAAATLFPTGRTSVEVLLRAADQQTSMLRLYGVMTVVTLLLDFVLIRQWEANGAAIANGVILIAQAIGLLALARRTTSLKLRQLGIGAPLVIAVATALASLGLTWRLTPHLALFIRPALAIGGFFAVMQLFHQFRPQELEMLRAGWSRVRSVVLRGTRPV